MADSMTAGVKLINPENVISKLADRALLAKGLECSLLTEVICMLRAEPAAKPVEQIWIPVTEGLPEERESIFKKFHGTNKWTSAMFQTISDNVLAVVSHKDGSKTVKTMCTLDGEWRIADGRPWNVTHWMPLPQPPEEVK